jgi:hypothetical protein
MVREWKGCLEMDVENMNDVEMGWVDWQVCSKIRLHSSQCIVVYMIAAMK